MMGGGRGGGKGWGKSGFFYDKRFGSSLYLTTQIRGDCMKFSYGPPWPNLYIYIYICKENIERCVQNIPYFSPLSSSWHRVSLNLQISTLVRKYTSYS